MCIDWFRVLQGGEDTDQQTLEDSRLNDVVKLTMQVLSSNTDVALQTTGAWMLGRVSTASSERKNRKSICMYS